MRGRHTLKFALLKTLKCSYHMEINSAELTPTRPSLDSLSRVALCFRSVSPHSIRYKDSRRALVKIGQTSNQERVHRLISAKTAPQECAHPLNSLGRTCGTLRVKHSGTLGVVEAIVTLDCTTSCNTRSGKTSSCGYRDHSCRSLNY